MPRRTHGGLAAWLKDARTPLFVVDDRRVVLFFNQGCEHLTGWSAADVVGRTCLLSGEPDGSRIEALTGALCPPPLPLDSEFVLQDVVVPCRSGETVLRQAVYIPLPAADGSPPRVLGLWVHRRAAPAESVAEAGAGDWRALLASHRDELRRHFQLDQIIAMGPAMRRVVAQVRAAAATSVCVHLTGPRGSGREFLARVIHAASPAGARTLVPLDCSALTAFELQRTLMRLLDDRRSLQSPTIADRPAAVLLKEVAKLPRDLQRLLCERWPASTAGDLRWFSTSNEPLDAAVADERFIPELFYHLTGFTIDVPALRSRRDDLPLLAQLFVEAQNRLGDRQIGGLAPETLLALQGYNWPGEARELRAVICEAHAASSGPLIQPADLPFRFRTGMDAQRIPPAKETATRPLDEFLREVETLEIRRVLHECAGNRALAARRLGLTRPKLYRRLEQLGLAAVNSTRSETGEPAPDSSHASHSQD